MIELTTQNDALQHLEELKTLARDICMHVAVMNPPFLNPESVDTASLDKEKEIIREQLKASGKPENMIDKIMGGKINKFYEESCLIKQRFIKNDDQTIEQLVEQLSKKINTPITIKRFVRFAIGR
jgi:elongation factor Ts